MTPGEKIIEIQKYSNLKWVDLAKKLGMKSPQTFIDIRNGKIGISSRLVQSILAAYPEINPMWMNGMSSQMFVNGTPQSSGASNIEMPVLNSDIIPKLNVSAILKGLDAVMTASGNEMAGYSKGDIMLLKRVVSISLLVPGRNYVVNTKDSSMTGKLAAVTDDTLQMETSTDAHDIAISEITSVYEIVGVFYMDSLQNNEMFGNRI